MVQMADERRNTLKLLAKSANVSHRWATASASAAIAHVVAAGHSLAQARDLCEEGGWTRWLRKNFDGSLRTAQRYMRVARHLPAARLDATRVSLPSQRAVLRAIRGAVFTSPPDAGAAPAAAGALTTSPLAAADDQAARRALAVVAARRLRKVASALSAAGAGDYAEEVASRINALAADLLLDVDAAANTRGEAH